MSDANDPLAIPVTIKVTETLGSQTFIHFPTGHGLAIAAVHPDHPLLYDEQIYLRAISEKVLFFDMEGGCERGSF